MATGCRATNLAGRPCSATVWRDGWCRWHSPELEHERREWSRAGGRGKSNRQRAKKGMADQALTPGEIEGYVAVAMKAVLSGRLEPGVGNAVANLARAAVAVREATMTEERLAALESAAGLGDGNGRRLA